MKDFLHDLALSLLMGLTAAAVLTAVLFTAGFFLRQFQPREGLVFVRGGLLITGALGLFVCAGLLIRPQGGAKLREDPRWRRHFRLFGLFPVTACAAVVPLVIASVLDYMLYFS